MINVKNTHLLKKKSETGGGMAKLEERVQMKMDLKIGNGDIGKMKKNLET